MEGKGLDLTTAHRIIVYHIVLETKGLKGIRAEGSRLASSVERKGTM
ncbi:hypothetical protein A2U01_0099948, partial [Trifolium medium]|nr:hypothetical protein [Trifolium medium]